MIATIVLVGAFNLPDDGNSTQRETVQEVPGVFNSQRSKERDQQNCHLGLLEGRFWTT